KDLALYVARPSFFIVFTNLLVSQSWKIRARQARQGSVRHAPCNTLRCARADFGRRDEPAGRRSEHIEDGREIRDDLLRARLLDRRASGRRAWIIRHRGDRRADLVGPVSGWHRPPRHPSGERATRIDVMTGRAL